MIENQILKGRYKVIRSIGSGGMAEVYLGEDLLLNRQVAIKVLRDQYLDDKDLLKQFKREAQSAARLSHPSIINVFDVCEEDDKAFIVMEYVEGQTLKSVLKEHGPLQPIWALAIATDIAAALSHAHKRNIVHCDIKPHNILMTDHMLPKIADFGIARMISNMTMVYTNSVIGTVHYLSPEQASGQPITAQSDLYSLGIVLYEMLTGHVPFDGNTAVAVAMMQVEKEPPPLHAFIEGIPDAFQHIIDKALAKSLDKRYKSADEMLADLNALKATLQNGTTEQDYSDTIGYNLPLMENTQPVVPTTDEAETEVSEDTIVISAVQEPLAEHVAFKEQEQQGWLQKLKTKQLTKKQQILIAVAVIVLSSLFLFIGNFLSRKTLEVPNVTGMQVVEAQKLIEGAGFEVVLKDEFDDKVTPGLVVRQDPVAKTMCKEGHSIFLYISKGMETVEVPNLVGKALAEAERLIAKKGFVLGDITVVHKEGAKGVVQSQIPQANKPIAHGSKIDLIILDEAKEVTMPTVLGLPETEAKAVLKKQGFNKISVKQVPSKREAGIVAHVTPLVGTKLMNDSIVILSVSNGQMIAAVNKYAEFVVPNNGDAQEIRIEVLDEDGRRPIYSGTQKPGVRLRQKVEVTGAAKAYLYSNNQLIEEKDL